MFSKSEASAFIRGLALDGKLYHFEDGSASEIVRGRTGEKLFTPEEAELVDKKVDWAYSVLDDPFEAAHYWMMVKDVSDMAQKQIPKTSDYWEIGGVTEERRQEIFDLVRGIAEKEVAMSFYNDEPERLGEVVAEVSDYVIGLGPNSDPISILTQDALDMAEPEDVTEFLERKGYKRDWDDPNATARFEIFRFATGEGDFSQLLIGDVEIDRTTASVFVQQWDESQGKTTHTGVTGNYEAMDLLARDIESKAKAAYPGAPQKQIEYAVYRLIQEGADQFTY